MKDEQLPKEGYKRTTEEIHRQYSRSIVQPGDLVLAIRATVGKVLPVPEYLPEANLTQGTARLSPGEDILKEYLQYILSSPLANQNFNSLSKGATFDEITLEMVRNFRIPLPPIEDQKAIVENISSHLSNISSTKTAAENVGSLSKEKRQTMITQAVTGQLDLTDWRPSYTQEATQ
jgi:type I restriction enzyme S subunit